MVTSLPSTRELQDFYAEVLHQNSEGQYSDTYSPEEVSYFNLFNELIYFIAKLHSPRVPSTFADIGCGEGYANAYFNALRLEVFAADFSDHGMRAHNPNTLNKISFKQCDIVSD